MESKNPLSAQREPWSSPVSRNEDILPALSKGHYYVPGTMLSVLNTWTHSCLKIILWNKYHYLGFTDKETVAQRDKWYTHHLTANLGSAWNSCQWPCYYHIATVSEDVPTPGMGDTGKGRERLAESREEVKILLRWYILSVVRKSNNKLMVDPSQCVCVLHTWGLHCLPALCNSVLLKTNLNSAVIYWGLFWTKSTVIGAIGGMQKDWGVSKFGRCVPYPWGVAVMVRKGGWGRWRPSLWHLVREYKLPSSQPQKMPLESCPSWSPDAFLFLIFKFHIKNCILLVGEPINCRSLWEKLQAKLLPVISNWCGLDAHILPRKQFWWRALLRGPWERQGQWESKLLTSSFVDCQILE